MSYEYDNNDQYELNESHNITVKVKRFERGRSSACLVMEDNTGCTYHFLGSEVPKIITGLIEGDLSTDYEYVQLRATKKKRGSNIRWYLDA